MFSKKNAQGSVELIVIGLLAALVLVVALPILNASWEKPANNHPEIMARL